jgi:putative nucleotidyltransferase with HDIG domain
MGDLSCNRVPTPAECRQLMEKYAMLHNIMRHSYQVMRVALAITDHLKEGAAINREMVMAGALLHDITKTRSLSTKERHDATGGALLRELGFPAVAQIVEQHVWMDHLDLDGELQEKEIVYYADKRVMHETIVTVEERMRDLITRYGVNEETCRRIRANNLQVLDVERKIAGFMRIDIDMAIDQVVEASSSVF